MFLLPARMTPAVEIFDLQKPEGFRKYNELLAEVGKTVRITRTKEQMVPGMVAPASEFGDGATKPDAFYVIVHYERTAICPYVPQGDFTVIPSKLDNRLPSGNKKILAAIDELMEDTAPVDPENIVIDITASTRAIREKSLKRRPRKNDVKKQDSVKTPPPPKKKPIEKKPIKEPPAPGPVKATPKAAVSKLAKTDLPKAKKKAKGPQDKPTRPTKSRG